MWRNQSKGDEFEKLYSLSLHQSQMPLLLSSHLLRKYGAGQVDLATIDRQQVTLYELKLNGVGVSLKQRWRLNIAANFVAKVLETPVSFKFIAK